jgi:uncharacterized membrane protein (UPF0127 family)
VNLEELRGHLDTPSGWEWVRRAAWSVLAGALLAFVVRGGASPADPSLASTDRLPLAGFDEVSFTITDVGGDLLEFCAMLAATAEARKQGLMGQRDLRGYDGMVFRYDEPTEGSFWMKDTLIPLAVAFFDAEGRFVSKQGMDPCPAGTPDDQCPSYPSNGAFLHALEVPRGGLGRLGIDVGSKIAFPGTPCR